jgi:putative transposase
MPIEEKTIVDIREEMALLALDERYTVREVAEMFGVTRPTVRLWRERYRENGRAGLQDRSHAPQKCPHRTAAEIEQMVIEERKRFKFGSKKILRRLKDAHPELQFPARSTVDAILARHGLVARQRARREPNKAAFQRRFEASEPGQLMTLDHKGEFRLGNGKYCYPLTMVDHVSRYILACQALDSTSFERAWPVIERVFREHGLPDAIQSDNGPPFGASNGKFSRLSVELMRLDVQPVFSRPGVPQDNARHERMHRDLKAIVIAERMRTFAEQQEQFDWFQSMFNIERPHESLQMKRPADVYTPPKRSFPRRKPAPEYEPHWEKRKVSETGCIRWKGAVIFIGHPFAGETVALEATDVDLWSVRFYRFTIGKLDEERGKFL